MLRSRQRALIEVPEGTTMFNVDEKAIYDSLKAIPWVKGVDVKREWPHTLVVTPVERKMRAIAFITADEVAWAIGEDGTWIAPLSLVVAVDAEGNEVALNDDGSVPEGAAQLPAFEAALRIAQDSGSLLLTDVPSDISPKGESRSTPRSSSPVSITPMASPMSSSRRSRTSPSHRSRPSRPISYPAWRSRWASRKTSWRRSAW